MSQPKKEFDSPWKIIIDLYFEDFMAYCWPKIHVEIDWIKGYKSLDKELNKISRNAPIGNRVVDKLIEVYLKNGEAAYVILHLEVQGSAEAHFEERMYVYHYRLRDLHHKPIVSLAILIDRDEDWRPGIFREALWGCSVEMRFPINLSICIHCQAFLNFLTSLCYAPTSSLVLLDMISGLFPPADDKSSSAVCLIDLRS